MDNKIKDLIYQLLEKETLQDIVIDDVLNLSKRSLYTFVLNLLNTCVECDMETLKTYDKFFENLNPLVDDFIMDNEEIVDKYYNIVALNLISFYTHAFYCDKRQDGIFDVLSANENIYSIIRILNDYGSLSQADLARQLGINTTTLSNRLNTIKDQNVVRKYKLPTNQKQTYYALTSDCKRYYNRQLAEEERHDKRTSELAKKYSERANSEVPELQHKVSVSPISKNVDKILAELKSNLISSFFKDKASHCFNYSPLTGKESAKQSRAFATASRAVK